MISNVISAAVIGLEAYKVTVETDENMSLPSVSIVGLPDAAVSEAKERLRAAIKNSGYVFPNQKVIINLAPADIKKEGTNFDLPMAIGILAREGLVKSEKLKNTAFIGELSLDGSLRKINGVLVITQGLKKCGIKSIVVPEENAREASLVDGMEVLYAKNLHEIVEYLNGGSELQIKKTDINIYLQNENAEYPYDFKDVKGQNKAKRALEIAAAGAHNVLMTGSPGSGKTLLAKCFPSILPPLEPEEAIELTKIYSVCGLLNSGVPIITARPFRTIHHKASSVGIIGGGTNPKPGEITLAHRGVLFLDEMAEFSREVLEVLRQPLEDGCITISRALSSVKYPADFMLLGAMNPCPCGYLGDNKKQCTCNEFQISRYRSRISGPLLDRIDLQICVPRLSQKELTEYTQDNESSEKIRKRVINARKIQLERYKALNILTNNELTPKLIKEFCKIDSSSTNLMKNAVDRFHISGRTYDRILKLSRTIADLDSSVQICPKHIAEALQYRGFNESIYV